MEAEAVVNVAKGAIEGANSALDLYNKSIDQIIPWDTFQTTIQELSRYKEQYSVQASESIGEVKTLLMNSLDNYSEATQNVYEWCGTSSELLTAYISLFENYDEKKANAQKGILIKVLEMGINKMTKAQELLQGSLESFNSIVGKLFTLDKQLSSDFDENSSYFKNQVAKIRKEAYGGAAAGVILGPLGLAISYTIASSVTEGKIVPELKKKFNATKNFYNNLHTQIDGANKKIDSVKDALKNEIFKIGEIKTTADSTMFYVEYDDLMLTLLKDSANKLINLCKEYQKNHGKKNI